MKKTNLIPDKFYLQYEWREGSMPPPHYYEFTIRINSNLNCEIVFLPDYPSHNPPVWKEPFKLVQADIDQLHRLMLEKDIFRESWAVEEKIAEGGSYDWMDVKTKDRQFRIHSAIRDREKIEAVYQYIKSLVPQKIWSDLHARRDKFEQEYSDKR